MDLLSLYLTKTKIKANEILFDSPGHKTVKISFLLVSIMKGRIVF
jgi:hypothetical protein